LIPARAQGVTSGTNLELVPSSTDTRAEAAQVENVPAIDARSIVQNLFAAMLALKIIPRGSENAFFCHIHPLVRMCLLSMKNHVRWCELSVTPKGVG
jgi:hypothetical protein